MDNHQISRIAAKHDLLRNAYIGTLPEKMLATINLVDIKRRKKPCFLIVNTQSDPRLFGHWLLLVIKSKNNLLFFDSMGNHPFKYGENIAAFCKNFKNVTLCSRKQLQSSKSIHCGAFCIYFAFKICERYSVTDIIRTFDVNNLEKNDRMVEKFTVALMNGFEKCSDSLCASKTFQTLCEILCTCNH
jgi:hypothetical protein